MTTYAKGTRVPIAPHQGSTSKGCCDGMGPPIPPGETVGDWMLPQIEQTYSTQQMPPMLPPGRTDRWNAGHPPDARDATGRLISDYYCPRCDHYSGGGLCRVCRREIAVEEANAATIEDSSAATPDHTRQQPLL